MEKNIRDATPLSGLDEDAALRTILEGTATHTGEGFFRALVETLARALGTDGAWVTQYFPARRRLRSIALFLDGNWIDDYEFDIAGTPCETVIDNARFVHIPNNLIKLYPLDDDFRKVGAVSYMGVPLLGVDGCVLGHMAVVDRRPMPDEPRAQALFRIFAARATAEIQRLRAEAEVREREEKLRRLIDSAMDAIVELDEALRVSLLNTAAEQVFACRADDVLGSDFGRFLADNSRSKLASLVGQLAGRSEGPPQLWIAGGLEARDVTGKPFPAEATLSRFELRQSSRYTLILRNVDQRREAEERIRSLTIETETLREELSELHGGEILGRSPALRRVLRDIGQVAGTDATVLVLGETGTGKELIARSIHEASRRGQRPLVRVNCAAVAPSLIESEFFGHEKGAFTGATQRREGRFALADGGTIFLDEVGELPLDLQAKLLRVLQEGEFEPVGSSRTSKVDVRVIAATNRDLASEARNGRFREDLFYRLNVFPLRVPPLRDRPEDIPLLAEAFARRCAQRMARTLEPLSDHCLRRLQAYPWPGNVRELQNVIERAVIICRNGTLDLERALPETAAAEPAPAPASCLQPGQVLTSDQMHELERENIVRALKAAGWKVSGEGGAAQLLGMKPSTLSSRIKAMQIHRTPDSAGIAGQSPGAACDAQ